MAEPIEFICSVYAVKTLVDQGLNITLALPETAIMQAAMLMECKRMGVVLQVSATPMQNPLQPDTPDAKKGRPERRSLRAGR